MMRAQGLIRTAVVVLLVVAVSGCGRLPKPFRSATPGAPDALINGAIGAGVRVQVSGGTTKPMAKLLAEAVVARLVERGVPSSTGAKGAYQYSLDGRAEVTTAWAAGLPAAKIHWRLREPNGELLYSFTEDVSGSEAEWAWGSPKVLAAVGNEASALVFSIVQPEDETLKAVAPVLSGVWIKPISGTPGDGDKALIRAMRYALTGAGIAVTRDRAAARHILEGEFKLGAPKNGVQDVELAWIVKYREGGVVGRAVQRNSVRAGTFDGAWGETGADIAAAAVGGINDVLSRAEETVRYRIASGRRLNTDVGSDLVQPAIPPPDLSPDVSPSSRARLTENSPR